MGLTNINAAYSLCQSLYGITPDEDSFEDLALEAYGKINNHHTRLYRYVGDVVNGKLKLPCNVDFIESVHVPMPDSQNTSNLSHWSWGENIWIEAYIDAWKMNEDPYWTRGKLVKYDEGNQELYFSRDYPRVMVVYHGIFVDDEDGLPLVNDKELTAIATFVAYSEMYKDCIKKRQLDKYSWALLQSMEAKWLKYCNAARVKEQFSQNDMDRVLDAKTSWNRKSYGKTFKPIK